VSIGEIVIVGMGPAGTALAIALARDGIDVSLIDGGEPTPTVEGYSQRTTSLLENMGLHHSLASLGGPISRNGTWGVREAQGFEWIGDRATLHRALRQDAREAGVSIVQKRWNDALTEQAKNDGAKIVIHAHGRKGRATHGPRLLALAATGPSISGQPETCIGRWARGWYWLADNGTRTQIQLVGSPQDGHPASWLRSLSETQPRYHSVLNAPRHALLARAATARLAHTDDPLTRVGDAAVAIDPLSGHGVYEALISARMHVAAVRTVLAHGRIELVRQYLTDRRAETWNRTTGVAAQFYAEQEGHGPFWDQTASAYRRLAEAAQPQSVSTSRIERKAVLENGYIREASVVVTPELPRGAWKLAGIPLVELHCMLATESETDQAIERASRHFGCSVMAAKSATSWLRASGLGVSQSRFAY